MRWERIRTLIFIGALFATSFGGIAAAWAAADYETLMREGVSFRRAGDDSTALTRFQQAYELNKSPRALAQIGLAEQALGRWAAADKHLRLALESGDDPWIKKNRASFQEALLVIEAHVGQLDVSGHPAGAQVLVDGELIGHLPLPHRVTVTAGGVALEVRAPGYVPIVRAATIFARTLTRETFKLQAISPIATADSVSTADSQPRKVVPPPTLAAEAPGPSGSSGGPVGALSEAPPEPAAGISAQRVVALVAAGLSIGSLTFGVIEHWTEQKKVTSFGSMGCGHTFPDKGGAACMQLFDDGERAYKLAVVGYGLAAAFAATAVILYLADSGRGAAPQKVACAPAPTGGMAGLSCALRF